MLPNTATGLTGVSIVIPSYFPSFKLVKQINSWWKKSLSRDLWFFKWEMALSQSNLSVLKVTFYENCSDSSIQFDPKSSITEILTFPIIQINQLHISGEIWVENVLSTPMADRKMGMAFKFPMCIVSYILLTVPNN